MRRLLLSLSCLTLLVGGLFAGYGFAQTEPPGPSPDMKIILSVDQSVYHPGDEINMIVSLSNLGGDEIVRKEWADTEFWLFLQFSDEKGKIITSDQLSESSTITPPPPRVFPDSNDVLVQGILVEILPNGWSVSFVPFDAHEYYPLAGKSGFFKVKAVVPIITFLGYDQTAAGVKYSRRFPPPDMAKWWGSIESNAASFTLVGDADGDGYYYPMAYGGMPADCDDTNPNVHPGATEIPGNKIDDDCDPLTPDQIDVRTGTIAVRVDKHTISSGSRPASSKEPLGDVPMRVFDKSPGSCVFSYGVSWQHYPEVWAGCNEIAFGTTGTSGGDTGTLQFAVPPGSYLVIGRYDSGDGAPIYIGSPVEDLQAGQTVNKYLQVMIKANQKKAPGKSRKLGGSELWIIEPEYVEWDGTEELYPFIFQSIGDWAVTTSVNPPEGFVADHESLGAEVNSEIKAVQFTITDVGSSWVPTDVTYTIKHKNKTTKIKSKVGVKLSEALAKRKGVDQFGNKVKGN